MRALKSKKAMEPKVEQLLKTRSYITVQTPRRAYTWEDWTWQQAVAFLVAFAIVCGPWIYFVIAS